MPIEHGLRDLNVNEISLMLKILHGETSLAEMSRQLDITLQGVRYYVTSLREKGYMIGMNLTQEGYEYLTESLKLLKNFITDNTEAIFNSLEWECISDDEIKQNSSIFLEMKGGFLHASLKGKHESATAIATESASRGRRVRVRDIKGIIKIDFGIVSARILEKLSNSNFTIYRDIVQKEAEELGEETEVFILGEGVATLFPDRKFSSFSPLSAAFEAASRGLNAVVFATREAWNLNDEKFNNLLKKNGMIRVNVTSVKI